jgi:RNA polymerase sigma-70 factor (ECF subfamily)
MKLSRSEFERMALEHVDMLYRIARRLTRDETAAEDLVQETYLRALRSFEGFELKEYGIRPWLLRIMHNLHHSRFKREKRQPVAVEDEQLLQAASATSGSDGSAPMTGAALWEGMDEQLVKAMESLPEEYQTVLVLWAIDELSYKEIAEAVEVPIGTVMSRLFRARQKLSEQLQEFAVKEGILRPP